MELILADAAGVEKRYFECDFDIEVGGENTFELSFPYSEWQGDIKFGSRIYAPETEYGGIVQDIQGDTSKDAVFVRGFTWRGYWQKKWFKGTLGGELNTILASLIGDYGDLFMSSPSSTGVSAFHTFNNYVSILEAAETILKPIGYRLSMKYVQTVTYGYVLVEAVKAKLYGDQISQDSFINFTTEDNRMGVNHVIGYDGTNTVNLYADAYGNISQTTRTFHGINEITDVYLKDTGEPNLADLIESATKHLQDQMNYQSITATFNSNNDEDIQVGDIVTGVDYITGIEITKAITSKVLTQRAGEPLSVQYNVEDDAE